MTGQAAARLLFAGLALALATQLNVRMERTTPWAPEYHSLYLPSGDSLRLVSLGNGKLMADALYIWSIQYYSIKRSDRWRNLARMYEVITELDPRFVEAYLTGALILATEAGRYEEAIELLGRGVEAVPESYVLPLEAGFYAKEIREYDSARRYFRIASARPEAPPVMIRWEALMAAEAGSTEEALAMWRDIEQAARNDNQRRSARQHIHDLTIRRDLEILQIAVNRFTAREGRRPFALAELVNRGIINGLPSDPSGEPYHYDRATGRVRSTSSFLSLYSRRWRQRSAER